MFHRFLSIKMWAFIVILLSAVAGETEAKFYDNSYTLVIGINKYPAPKWQNLKYALYIVLYDGCEYNYYIDEQPSHRVRITKTIYLQTTEVTQWIFNLIAPHC